jgi:hypothetical protein
VTAETIAEVLGRIEMLVQDSSEEIATRMLLDGATMEQVEATRSGKEREAFIASMVTEKKSEMEQQLRETQEQVAQERAARLAAEQAAAATEARLAEHQLLETERANREIEAASKAAKDRAMEEVAQARQRALAADQDRAAALKRQKEGDEEKEAAQAEARRISRLLAAVLFVVGIAVVAVPTVAGWISDEWPLVFLLLAGGGLWVAAVALIYGRRRAAAIVSAIALALGIATALYDMVSSDDTTAGTPPASKTR